MNRARIQWILAVIVAVCAMRSYPAFALNPILRPTCSPLPTRYAFYFWNASTDIAGSGVFSLSQTATRSCTWNVVGGEINCHSLEGETLSLITGGTLTVGAEDEGTLTILTSSSFDSICDVEPNIELDVAIGSGGDTIFFNSNGSQFILGNTSEPNIGSEVFIKGRADNATQAGQLNGCYNFSFWASLDDDTVGNCTLCFAQYEKYSGKVTGGHCRCSRNEAEYSSVITDGDFFLETDGEGSIAFESGTGPICGYKQWLQFEVALANGGKELLGNCSADLNALEGTVPQSGYDMSCAVEGTFTTGKNCSGAVVSQSGCGFTPIATQGP